MSAKNTRTKKDTEQKTGGKKGAANNNNASGAFNKFSASSLDQIEKFQRGILNRDLDLVERALKAGVSPDTNVQGSHPLQVLLYNVSPPQNAFKNAAARKRLSEEKYSRNTSRLVDLLLSKNPDLTDGSAYSGDYVDRLIDTLMDSPRLADASNVIVHGILQSMSNGPSYRPQINRFVASHVETTARASGGDFDFEDTVAQALRQYKEMHDVVRARLQDPRTRAEIKLVKKYPKKIKRWTKKLNVPSVYEYDGLRPEAGLPPREPQQNTAKAADKGKYDQEMGQMVTTLQKKTPEQALAEMDKDFIGMEGLKDRYKTLAYLKAFDAGRATNGLPAEVGSNDTVYLGPPGVGKTTAGRKKAELLYALDLAGPNYAEITREKLVGAYIGHTEEKWFALLSKADIIFIDEAYALFDGRKDSNDFGKHIISALLSVLENNPGKVIFLAGYKDKMEEFFKSNPGLRSRVTNFEDIEAMDKTQLGKVMDLMLNKRQYEMDQDAKDFVLDELEKARQKLGPEYFGNAREVRKVVGKLREVLAKRLFGQEKEGIIIAPAKEDYMRVTLEDVKGLNLPMLLGGKAVKGKSIGFTAQI